MVPLGESTNLLSYMTQMRDVRVVHVSDTHGFHTKYGIPRGDILIHTGDFCHNFGGAKEYAAFDQWLGMQSRSNPSPLSITFPILLVSHIYIRQPPASRTQLATWPFLIMPLPYRLW